MKFKLVVNPSENVIKAVYLDRNNLFIEDGNEKILIETSYEDRVNTLISLFSLKNSWIEKTCFNNKYEVMFENEGIVEKYLFDENTPDNWFLFSAYLVKLVGDNL